MLAAPGRPWPVAHQGHGLICYAYASAHQPGPAYDWCSNVSAFACIAVPNPASVALHESCGFTLSGVHHNAGYKHGAWHDVGWWHCSCKNPSPAPSRPEHGLRSGSRRARRRRDRAAGRMRPRMDTGLVAHICRQRREHELMESTRRLDGAAADLSRDLHIDGSGHAAPRGRVRLLQRSPARGVRGR